MFSILESTWDNSGRRGWTTLVSFTMQALALSLLLVISLIWVAPPQVRWLQLSTPATFSPQPQTAAQAALAHRTTAPVTILRPEIVAPTVIPPHVQAINDLRSKDASSDPSAPDLPIGPATRGTGNVPDSFGNYSVAVPPRPVQVKPLLVSHLSEANLLHEVKPVYPPLARQARIQGAVELRAIISKSGTIENLVVVRGHPMLSAAAIEAVRQWRYRPYVLNGEPIEVETEITVNFLLSGG
jgi:protein TonB